jgi:hypothetical protein
MPDYTSQAARDAQAAGYGGASYWDYLDKHALELRDSYLAKGDNAMAEFMLTRSLCETLRGNNGP